MAGKQVVREREMKNEGVKIPLVHASNSGATLFQKEQFDMVRIGLLAYGYSPFDEENESLNIDLKPVMELLTEVVFIKQVKKGDSISYGRTWVAPKDTYIATLPIGYADGLSRSLSSKLKVRIFELVGTSLSQRHINSPGIMSLS